MCMCVADLLMGCVSDKMKSGEECVMWIQIWMVNPEFDIMDWPRLGVSQESTSVYCTHREYLYHIPGLYHMCTQSNGEKSRFWCQLQTVYWVGQITTMRSARSARTLKWCLIFGRAMIICLSRSICSSASKFDWFAMLLAQQSPARKTANAWEFVFMEAHKSHNALRVYAFASRMRITYHMLMES